MWPTVIKSLKILESERLFRLNALALQETNAVSISGTTGSVPRIHKEPEVNPEHLQVRTYSYTTYPIGLKPLVQGQQVLDFCLQYLEGYVFCIKKIITKEKKHTNYFKHVLIGRQPLFV